MKKAMFKKKEFFRPLIGGGTFLNITEALAIGRSSKTTELPH